LFCDEGDTLYLALVEGLGVIRTFGLLIILPDFKCGQLIYTLIIFSFHYCQTKLIQVIDPHFQISIDNDVSTE
jgi:hypothetical protein